MERCDDRLRILIGEEGTDRLRRSRVSVCGVGGVGGYVVEALARSFLGGITILDGDCVARSNLNRQLVATERTIGQPKVTVMAARVREISPETVVTPIETFITVENALSLPIWDVDYIVDAIDDVAAKVALIAEARRRGVPVISAMGAANRTDPMAFRVADISETHTCPLAKKMRRELQAVGITEGVKVVYSTEKPASFGGALGSNAYVPAAAGLLIARTVTEALAKRE